MASSNLVNILSAKVEVREPAHKPFLLVSDVTDFHGAGGMCLQSNPCQHTAYFTIDLPQESPPPQAKRHKAGGPPSLSRLRHRNCEQISTGIDGHTACLIGRMMGNPPEEHFKKYDDRIPETAVLPAEIEFKNFVLRYDRAHDVNVERQRHRKAEARKRIKAELAELEKQRSAITQREVMLEAKYKALK